MDDKPIVYKLKARATPGPQCMFKVNRPDIGIVGEGYIFDVLLKSCEAWRRANGIPIGLEFEREVEQAVCSQHPDICETDDPRAPLSPQPLNLKQVILGTKVMVSLAKNLFRDVVNRDEAERRAAICAGCKLNVTHSMGCSGGLCGELLEIVKRFVSHGTSLDDRLHACFICGCRLQVAVWVDRELQWKPMSDHMKAQFIASAPPNCWKKP